MQITLMGIETRRVKRDSRTLAIASQIVDVLKGVGLKL